MKGIKFNLPYNKSKLYLEHTLYNGCKLYIPLASEETREIIKPKLEKFNEYQKMVFEPESPEAA